MPGISTNSADLLSQLNSPFDLNVSSGSHFLQPEALQTALEVSPYKHSASSSLIDEALQSAETQLRTFAADPAFTAKMNLAFGTNWDVNVAKDFAQSWLNGSFSTLPTIAIRSGSEINEADGAFAAKINTIYLSSDFLSQSAKNPGAVTAVLLEEIGHAIDFRINKTDAAGDEGDIFSRLVRGETISANELLELKTENDHAVISINGQSFDIEMSQIGMTSLNNVLYQSHQGTNNQIYTRSTKDGVNWTAWNNSGGSTYSAPALTTLKGRIYQAHRGTDNKIYTHSSTDGVNWTPWNNNGGGETTSAPAMAMFKDRVYQSHRGIDNNLYIRSSTDGMNWTNWNSNGGGSTYSAPALATLDGKLYQTHRGTDNKIYTRSSTDGANWSNWNNNGGGETASAPALAVFNGKLYQTHRGTNNKIYTRYSTNGANWSNWSNAGGGETPDAPSLVASNNRLYQSHQGMNNKIYTRWTTDGTNWTTWTENGGSTPTEKPIAPPQKSGIDIQLHYPTGGFSNHQKAVIEKAVQNWERIITKDKDSSGVLKLTVTAGSTMMAGDTWKQGVWAVSLMDSAIKYRQNFGNGFYDGKYYQVDFNGVDSNSRTHFNSNELSKQSDNQLIRLTMHEIAHTLGLDEAFDPAFKDGDRSLELDSLMDRKGLDNNISEGMYRKLESLGYGVNRNVSIVWS